LKPLSFNFFDLARNGGATWDGRNLRVNIQQKAELPEIHIDLGRDKEGQTWTGSFERADFHNQTITLRRPVGPSIRPFAGTWFAGNQLMNNCLHIAQAQDGSWTGWSDDIQIPGRIRYANGIRPPERVMEHYGEVAKVKVTEPDRIEVELRAYTPICCSHPFTAAISRDENSLIGDWLPRLNQVAQLVRWTRVQGDSCITAAKDR
jgi:hypothetical protein